MVNVSYSSLVDRNLKMYSTYGIVLIVIFVFAMYKATKDRVIATFFQVCFVMSVFLVVFIACDLTLRLFRMLISLTDANREMYEDQNITSLLSYYFDLNTASKVTIIVVFAIFLLGLIFTRRCPLSYVWDFGPYVCVSLMILSFLLLRAINLARWETRSSSLPLGFMKGLDYGTGMAYSYYYGYLRMVLPSTGTTSKGIVEKIEIFEDTHNVTFPVHKLFILIPSSTYIPPNLKEASDHWMESVHELEEEKRNRAGNIGRSYRNNVYKIYPGGRDSGASPIYVAAEGASPLLTFFEVQKHSHPESATYKQYKNDIVSMFHNKLQRILQSEPDTKDLCELIQYNDYDENGDKVNVAEIILQRISKIKNSTY